MFRRILVPVSEASVPDRLVEAVVGLARLGVEEVTLLQVAPAPRATRMRRSRWRRPSLIPATAGGPVVAEVAPPTQPVYVESRDQAVERREHELGEELDVLARPLRALGCAVRTVIRFGEPAAEVLEVARAGEFDLVVVAGTPHAAGRALRPGIASRLMRSGLAPVLLVPQHRSARKERRRAG